MENNDRRGSSAERRRGERRKTPSDRDELQALLGKPPVQPGDEHRPEVGHVPDQQAAD